MSDADLQFTIKAQDQVSQVLKGMGSSFTELSATVKAQAAQMAQLTASLTQLRGAHTSAAGALKEAAGAIEDVGAAAAKAGAAHREHAAGAREAEGGLRKLVNSAKEAAEAFAAIWASTESIEKTIGAFAEAEVGILRMKQSMGLTTEAAYEMHEALDKIASVSLGVTVDQLQRVASGAKALGLSKEEATAFADATAQMAVVTGQSAEAISAGMGRILEATGETKTGVHTFAEAFAKLSTDTRGGAQALMSTAEVMVRMTADTKITALQILGLSDAMSHLGVSGKSASMSVGGAMENLQQFATDSRLEGKLAAVAGALNLTVDQFKALEKSDPTAVFMRFLGAVKDVQGAGGDLRQFLQQFNLGGRAMETTFAAAAKNIDVFKAKLQEAKDAAGGNFLEKAFGEYGKTISGQVDQIQKSFATLGETMGKALGPSVSNILGNVQTALNGVAAILKYIQEVSGDTGVRIIAGLIVGLPAILAVQKAFTFLTEVVLTGIGTFRRMGGVLGELTRFFTLFRVAEEEVATGAVAVEAGLTGIAAKEGAVAVASTAAEAGIKKVTVAMEAQAGIASKLLGFAGSLGAAYLTMDILDPEDKAGDWIDSHIPGASFLDNAASKISIPGIGPMGRSYKDQKEAADEFKRRKDEQAKLKKEAEGEHGEKKTEAAASEGAPVVSEAARDAIDTHNSLAILTTYLSQLKELAASKEKVLEITREQADVEKLANATDEQLKAIGLTREQLAAESDLLKLRQLELDPLNKQTQAFHEAMEAANAYTKAQEEAAATETKVREAREAATKNHEDPNVAERVTRSQQGDLNATSRDTAARHELESLTRALGLAAQLTAADRQRLEIDNQIVQLYETHNYTSKQLDDMRQLLTLTKDLQRANEQFASLNPQAKAQQNYKEQLELLEQRRPGIGEDEYKRERTALDQQTLAARSPIGKIVQDQQDEIAQLGIIGKYREADLKSLQQITDLKRMGLDMDHGAGAEASKQIQASNRMVQDIKQAQSEIDQLTDSFASGLSNAVQGAFSGDKHAFSKFGLSMGTQMLQMGLKDLMKNFEGQVGGLFTKGMLGDAAKGTQDLAGSAAKLDTNAADAASKAIAQQTIMAQQVTLIANNIAGLPGAPGGTPGLPGAPGSTPAIPGVPSAPGGGSPFSPTSFGDAVPRAPSAATPSFPGGGGADVGSAIAPIVSAGGGFAGAFAGQFGRGGAGMGFGFAPGGGAGGLTGAGPQSSIPETYGAGVHGMFGDKLSDGIRITDPMVKSSHPEINGEAIQNGLKEGFGKLKDAVMPKTPAPGVAASDAANGVGVQPAAVTPPVHPPAHTLAAYRQNPAENPAFNPPGQPTQLDPATLQYLQGHAASAGVNVRGLDPQFAQTLTGHMQAAEAAGFHPQIQSGYRSFETQRQLKANNDAFKSGQPKPFPNQDGYNAGPVAAPGDSLHQYGRAADVTDPTINLKTSAGQARYQEYRQSMQGDGLYNGVRGDPSHFQDSRGYPNRGPTAGLESNATKNMQSQSAEMLKKQTEQFTEQQKSMTAQLGDTSKQFGTSFQGMGSSIKGVGSEALGAVPDMSQFGNSISEMVSKLGSAGGGGGGGGFGGLFGGGGGGGGFGDFSAFEAFHGGGLVGSTFGGTNISRHISASAFRGARRFHDGLNDDEFPAVLQRGERVITQGQESRTARLIGQMSDQMATRKSGAPPSGQTPAGRGAAGSRINMVINTKDANSFRYSQPQIMATMQSHAARAGSKHN